MAETNVPTGRDSDNPTVNHPHKLTPYGKLVVAAGSLEGIASNLEIAHRALEEELAGGSFNDAREVAMRRENALWYFSDRINEHVAALRKAHRKITKAHRKLNSPEPEQEPEPLPVDMLALWREFRAAHDGFAGAGEPGEAVNDRFQAVQQAIMNAKPSDPGGIAVQLAYLRWVCDGSDPGDDADVILGHAVEALTPAGQEVLVLKARLEDGASS